MENESTSATTRQYVPQQPANPYDAPYQSQFAQARSAPDNQFDDQPPDTSRLYQTPMAQSYPNYPANYQQPAARKSGAIKWVVITLLCLLLVAGGIGVIVISAIRARHDAARQIADEVRQRIEDELERARQEAERAARESGESPPSPPAPPLPPNSGAGLEQYKYPNAKVNESFAIFGNDSVMMVTSDSVSKVRDYYKSRFGNPWIEDEDSAVVIFKISGSPATLITINEDKEGSDGTQITVVQSEYIQLPKLY